MGDKLKGGTNLLSLNSLRTSLRYVFRMLSTEKTKQNWYSSRHSRTLAKSFRVNSFPFLSTFVRWTTFARLDLGILLVGGGQDGGGERGWFGGMDCDALDLFFSR